jgi:hypothetical protein
LADQFAKRFYHRGVGFLDLNGHVLIGESLKKFYLKKAADNTELTLVERRQLGGILWRQKDLVFEATIKALAPQWFKTEIARLKKEAVELLRGGEDTPSRCDVWPTSTLSLLEWFRAQTRQDSPFELNAHTTVVDAGLFYAALQRDIAAGPSGPRARTGALECDLADLKRILH